MMAGRASLLAALMLGACGEATAPAWSGYAEGEYVYVAAPLAGALTRLEVQPGQDLSAGAPLFALESDLEQAARDEARARLAQALAEVDNAAKGRRSDEVAMTQAQLAQARAQATLARSDLMRQQQLLAQGFVSPARIDDARTALAQAEARVGELESALRVARLPARSDEQRAARAVADAASQALRQSQWREQQKVQRAPAAARVVDTYFRVGEWVPAGAPVVALLPAGAVKARFFVPEAEVASLAAGQYVQVTCDGCATPIVSRITRIATQAEYTPPVIYSNAQRAKLVFMVEAKPEGEAGARLHPGQPLDVRRATATAGAAASRP
ncbi:MAG: HlyD family efflux transporter periplasmic adaptor subunit [Burkholderiaceae bacterium]|nr:HlyD family efflux transporter periplasmic adaptor subunit [Burkholderiaceae bacterium]